MHRPQSAAVAVLTALIVGVRAQNQRGTNHSSAIIALIVAAVFILVLCCGIQRRRVARAAAFRSGGILSTNAAPYVPPPFPPTNSSSRYPHGMQYGAYGLGYTPPAVPPHMPAPGSEYPLPPTGAADWAPPPYVKEGKPVGQQEYAPPPGPPPPGFDAVYTPPPGPPPRAHISSNSQDFNGGFRPPPAA